jgi:hypothetical protein
MTPAELIEARKALGLSAADLGRLLRLEGRDQGRTVRRWETGESAIPGPAQVAIELMLRLRGRRQNWKAGHGFSGDEAQAQPVQENERPASQKPGGSPPILSGPISGEPETDTPPRSRRRG